MFNSTMLGTQWTNVNISRGRKESKEGGREGRVTEKKREKDDLTFSLTLKRDQSKIQVKKKYTRIFTISKGAKFN